MRLAADRTITIDANRLQSWALNCSTLAESHTVTHWSLSGNAARGEQRPRRPTTRRRRRAAAMAERLNPNMLFANFNQDFT